MYFIFNFIKGLKYENSFDLLVDAIKSVPPSKEGKPMLLVIDDFSNLMNQKGEKIDKIKDLIISSICDLSSNREA